MIVHLTYTGPLAGQRLCDDTTPRSADVRNVHAVYCPDIDAPEVCAVCRAIWYDAAEEAEREYCVDCENILNNYDPGDLCLPCAQRRVADGEPLTAAAQAAGGIY